MLPQAWEGEEEEIWRENPWGRAWHIHALGVLCNWWHGHHRWDLLQTPCITDPPHTHNVCYTWLHTLSETPTNTCTISTTTKESCVYARSHVELCVCKWGIHVYSSVAEHKVLSSWPPRLTPSANSPPSVSLALEHTLVLVKVCTHSHNDFLSCPSVTFPNLRSLWRNDYISSIVFTLAQKSDSNSYFSDNYSKIKTKQHPTPCLS